MEPFGLAAPALTAALRAVNLKDIRHSLDLLNVRERS